MAIPVLLAALAGLAAPATTLQIACAGHLGVGAVPGVYPTRAAAEAGAKFYNCSGAHPMGTQWMPCSSHPGAAKPAGSLMPKLYPTKAEAEAAAKQLNCTGAHAMGNQWMPCSGHPMGGASDRGTAPKAP
jgi:hypothetical protein